MEVLKNYYSVVQEIKALELRKKSLRAKIITHMENEDINNMSNESFVAKQSERVRIEYDTEQIEHILLSQGFKPDVFMKNIIDLEKVGNLVAEGVLDESLLLEASSLKKYTTLTVRELNDEWN